MTKRVIIALAILAALVLAVTVTTRHDGSDNGLLGRFGIKPR